MKILLIGYSNIARKKIIPALERIGMEEVHVATSRKNLDPEGDIRLKIFDSYENGINKSDAEVVYISLVNSAHYEWAKKALLHGKHVIVDKPACLNYREVEELAELASEEHLCLAESVVYLEHPQINAVSDYLGDNNFHPTHITAHFCFPPLIPDNFRYSSKLGGGAILDLAAYAITPGRFFFGSNPEEIHGFITHRSEEVETSFSIAMSYPDGKSFIGRFGFNSEYQNFMIITGNNFRLKLDRVFTPPPDYSGYIEIHSNNTSKRVEFHKADSFALYIEKVLGMIKDKNLSYMTKDLLKDHKTLERLRRALD